MKILCSFVAAACLLSCRAKESSLKDGEDLSPSALECMRTDRLRRNFLRGVTKARIVARQHSYDSRVRFYNDEDHQVDTCSIRYGDSGYECFTSGMHGIGEILVMTIKTDPAEDTFLHARENFKMMVRSSETSPHARPLVFQCGSAAQSIGDVTVQSPLVKRLLDNGSQVPEQVRDWFNFMESPDYDLRHIHYYAVYATADHSRLVGYLVEEFVWHAEGDRPVFSTARFNVDGSQIGDVSETSEHL